MTRPFQPGRPPLPPLPAAARGAAAPTEPPSPSPSPSPLSAKPQAQAPRRKPGAQARTAHRRTPALVTSAASKSCARLWKAARERKPPAACARSSLKVDDPKSMIRNSTSGPNGRRKPSALLVKPARARGRAGSPPGAPPSTPWKSAPQGRAPPGGAPPAAVSKRSAAAPASCGGAPRALGAARACASASSSKRRGYCKREVE